MSARKFLTIIVIILFNKAINLRAENYSVLSVKKTIKKCCPLFEHVPKGRRCSNYSLSLDFSDFKIYDEDLQLTARSLQDIFDLDHGIFVRDKEFKKMAWDYSNGQLGLNMYLTETGTLYIEAPNEATRWRKVNSSNFCVDYLMEYDHNTQRTTPVPRFWAILPNEISLSTNSLYVTIGLLTSCVFLALVLVVYSLLPELRNLNGLVQMSYVACLLTAFLLLAILQIDQYAHWACRFLSYFFYFSLLASFCWMNLMSYDIWWTFRGVVKARPIHRFGELFKFKVYCAYAFGVPLAMTVFFITVDLAPMRHLPWFVTPNLIRKGCFIQGEEKLRYLYAPMLIMILMNWVFFLMTSFEIYRLHRQTAILDSSAAGARAAHRQHWARLLVYLKLSIIMGVSWVLEVVSSFTPQLPIWIVSDAYNFLIGISIFLIFVCKRKILRKLAKRFRTMRGPNISFASTKSSHSSHTTTSDASQDMPLQVCLNPNAACKHRYEQHYEFN